VLIEKFEVSYPKLAVADPNETPVNILCLDGGGMRGYALPALLRAIDEKYGEGKENDILEHFHLVAGTSVGGTFAFACNLMKSLQEACDEFTDGADDIRERVFSEMKVKTLLKTGASVPKEHQIEAIFKERFGDIPLLNSREPKAMVLAASRSSGSTTIEPFVFRTYDYPDDNVGSSNALVASSASFTGVQAAAATTALPMIVHSVKARLEDKDISFMDGSLYGSCPLHVAIDEARQLFPRRPLGVMLSIGFNDAEDALRDRVIKVARRVSPDLHFHRLAPSHITSDFKMTETNFQSVVEMEEKVHDFILTDSEVSAALDNTMKILYSNQLPTPGYRRRQAMLKNDKFQERNNLRKQVKEMLQKKSSQSTLTSKMSTRHATTKRTTHSVSPSSFDDDGGFHEEVNLKNEIFVEDSISAAENETHACCCGKRGWAACIPSFVLCSGYNLTPDTTNNVVEEDAKNLEVKSISMNRVVEVYHSNDDISTWSA